MGRTVELVAADEHRLAAYVAGRDEATRALVLCHDISGLTGHIRRTADRYAAFGYRVIAPALFDRIERGVSLHLARPDLACGAAIAAQIPVEAQMTDIEAAVDYLECERVGILGFGWGATVAWHAAARVKNLHAGVGYYGRGIADARQTTPACPMQLHFGEGDHLIPLSDVEAIAHAQPQVEIDIYPIADHLFACDEAETFQLEATEAAQDNMLAFLQRHMGGAREGASL